MVLTSGCFDGLHAGHVRYLQAARGYVRGETLRVAIAPDAYIREVKQREPYWCQADRAETVLALSSVDAVTPHDSLSVASVIRELQPRVFIKGIDWQDHLPEDVLAACFDCGTQIVFVKTEGRHVSHARG